MLLLRQLLRCVLQATLRLGGKGSVRKGGEGLGVGWGEEWLLLQLLPLLVTRAMLVTHYTGCIR